MQYIHVPRSLNTKGQLHSPSFGRIKVVQSQRVKLADIGKYTPIRKVCYKPGFWLIRPKTALGVFYTPSRTPSLELW